MTVFNEWVVKTVAALMRDAREDFDWDALERRIAIGLVQARALECRQIASSALMKQPPTLLEFIHGLNHRSSLLEKTGMDMAKQWPPTEEEEPEPGPRLVQ